jgi:hypothetical protein
MSVGRCTMTTMRIRTLAGPPLDGEILRDTLRSILLGGTAVDDPEDRHQRIDVSAAVAGDQR